MVPVLEMKQITKRFPGVVALNKFSIDVRAGEVHALVGENGAGKSTLIKTLYGVHQPDEGSIYLNGSQILIKNEADAISKGIGVVFQELNVCPHLDVANNIFLGCIAICVSRVGAIYAAPTLEDLQHFLSNVGVSDKVLHGMKGEMQ